MSIKELNQFGQKEDPKIDSLFSKIDYYIDSAIYELDFVKMDKTIKDRIMNLLTSASKLIDNKEKFR